MVGQCYVATAAPKLLEVTKNNGISIISMARAPVNSLNLALLTDLKEALITAQKENSDGVILTSSCATVFSAGLDLTEMYKPNDLRLVEFWTALQDAWIALNGLTIPTAAAINGNSPAGGCLLAMTCEHRVMVDAKFTIGLNETQLGIAAPKWFMTCMIDTIGYRQAEKALLKGKLFTPKEAIEIGLVDELATDKQDAIRKCQEYIESARMVPEFGRSTTKFLIRNDRIAALKNNREKDLAAFVSIIKNPDVQMGLGFYLESLKQKSKL
ncbi:enoyl-CoA delta isomerase 1, mitochondrial-like isoform X2 [Venturia canescens]|nr:enoyl-CoA delta isomerase 1, mitochondrial-like isoform X2 [Venturia canescens]